MLWNINIWKCTYLEKMFFEYVTTKGSQHEKVFYLIQLCSTSLYLLFSIVQHLIWTGPSVFFCFFFFNLLFCKDLWNWLSLCCLLQDLYHRPAMKLSASLNHFHRLCVKREWGFLPFFPLNLFHVRTMSSSEESLQISTSHERELIVLFSFSHKPHKAWSCCYQYHYFGTAVYKSEIHVGQSVTSNIETI